MTGFGRVAATILTAAALGGCTATGQDASGAPKNAAAPAAADIVLSERSTAQIYMFRGGFNGVFSTGISDMASELRRKGIPVHDLSWSASNGSLSEIKKAVSHNPRSGPIILVGHSLGAGSAITMAEELTNAGITVDLMIVFDSLGATRVPKGVRRFVSFKASGNKNKPGSFRPGKGFNGQIVNIDVRTLPGLDESSHWNIVNQKVLQKRVIREIETVYGKWKPPRMAAS